jgi:DNA-directed RNA polymerase specialized sigma subunit
LGQEPDNGFENCRKQEIAKVVQASLSKIKPVYRLIIEEYYFKNKSFLEISEERGRSKSWAWGLHNKAIKDMKKYLGSATFNLENFI